MKKGVGHEGEGGGGKQNGREKGEMRRVGGSMGIGRREGEGESRRRRNGGEKRRMEGMGERRRMRRMRRREGMEEGDRKRGRDWGVGCRRRRSKEEE